MKGIILTFIVFGLLLAGCTQTAPQKAVPETPAAQTPAPEAAPTPEPTPVKAETPLGLKDIFAAATGEYKCTANMQNVQTTIYVKNGKVRTDATTQGVEAHGVYNGDDIWSWSAVQGQQMCYHMKLSELQAMAASNGAVQKPASKDDMAQNAANVDCKAESVPDSMFTAPSPCQEFSELLKQMQQYQK